MIQEKVLNWDKKGWDKRNEWRVRVSSQLFSFVKKIENVDQSINIQILGRGQG